MSARGVPFDAAYCNQAVCERSRDNLMLGSCSTSTGLHTPGFNFRHALPDAITSPQHFMRNGYRAESLAQAPAHRAAYAKIPFTTFDSTTPVSF